MELSAFIISALALVFTIATFWWMNWRRGSLLVGPPRSYAAKGSLAERLLIELPLVFFNRGATPVVVQNLRLRLSHEASDAPPLTFTATVEKLGTDQGRALATQFPVVPQEARLWICEFQRTPGQLEFEVRSYEIILEAVLDNSRTWRELARFDLNVRDRTLPAINQRFITHDNWE
jgi:hypothetical protein